jgi:hypothetical protein
MVTPEQPGATPEQPGTPGPDPQVEVDVIEDLDAPDEAQQQVAGGNDPGNSGTKWCGRRVN